MSDSLQISDLPYQIKCSEIWGGNKDANTDVSTGALNASLFSNSMDGKMGGDIYYFSVCSKDQLTRIAVADVVGHGEIVSKISHWLYQILDSNMDKINGNVILDDLNKQVKTYGHDAMTTAVVLTINKMSSQLFFSYAGHPPLLIKRKNEDRWQQATIQSPSIPGNIPLGILDDPVFDEDNIALNSGDWIFLYTDGVIETFGENGQLFGIPRLMNFLEKNCNDNPSHLKQAVLNDLLQFSGGHLKHDDMTFMAIKIH